MAAKDAHLSDLLCHCPATTAPHRLTTPGCESTVTAGTSTSRSTPSAPNTLLEPWQSGGLYSALAAAATTPQERKRWRDHAKMLREAHQAIRRRPAPGTSARRRAA